MERLPTAPNRLRHGKVTVIFDRVTAGDTRRGFVPGYMFKVFNARAVEVGYFHLRIGDTEHIRMAAGHIGYEVYQRHRGNGYAGDACLAAAPWVAYVSGTVLITVDPDNIASIRTVERIGAIFLDEVDVPEGDPHYQRGSYRKRRYQWEPTKSF